MEARYAVVGLGWFAQESILPAFAQAEGSKLVALVSGDARKVAELSKQYGVEHAVDYDGYDELLESGEVDAVYIALPNSMHCEYTVRAAERGVHVLCEKPMALDEAECRRMIEACDRAEVQLMIAYRLHFEAANLRAAEIVSGGEIGEARLFNSVFTMQVKEDNTRLAAGLNAGPLYDIGVYCINAARSLFRAEPSEVLALTGTMPGDARFNEVEEQVAAILRFPGDRLATFAVSFGAEGTSRYQVIGTSGALTLEPAYSHSAALAYEIVTNQGHERREFEKKDQVAPEITYFSECIEQRRAPEPSGFEGLLDVRVIRALYESAALGQRVRLEPIRKPERPDLGQEQTVPTPGRPEELVHASSPH